jgi:hypothetical protein
VKPTSPKYEATDANTDNAAPYNIDFIGLKFLINLIPSQTGAESGGTGYRIVCKRIESDEIDDHAKSGAEAQVSGMPARPNLTDSRFLYSRFRDGEELTAKGIID